MQAHHRAATALTLLAILSSGSAAFAQDTPVPTDELRAFEGEWLYVEDRTEGRPSEQQGPPMSVTFGLRVEPDAVVMLRGKGASQREEPIPLDGSVLEETGTGTTTRRRGSWQDGTLVYEVTTTRDADGSLVLLIRREFRIAANGLLIRVVLGEPPEKDTLAFYQHPEDIPLPTPAPAGIADIEWLADAWVGVRGTSSIEERWSPPLGGAMLGTSRTVKNERMVAFEFLRIVERNGSLVYVAQPNGAAPTEFVLTESGPRRAVFDNPRHSSPQRIVYELQDDGSLTASIGFLHGGSPTVFEFAREGG